MFRNPGKAMRSKKGLIAFACIAIAAFALARFFGTSSKPSISMALLEYWDAKNDYGLPCAVVGLTNNGSVTVRYDHVDSDEPFILRTELRTGWSSNSFVSFKKMTLSHTFLAPGSNTDLYVYLPEGTLRWQLKYTIHKASIQSRIRNEFTGGLGNRLYTLSGYLGLTNEGPPQVFWSEVYEVPGGRQFDAPTNTVRAGATK